MTRKQITNLNNTQDSRDKTLMVCQGNIHGERYGISYYSKFTTLNYISRVSNIYMNLGIVT